MIQLMVSLDIASLPERFAYQDCHSVTYCLDIYSKINVARNNNAGLLRTQAVAAVSLLILIQSLRFSSSAFKSIDAFSGLFSNAKANKLFRAPVALICVERYSPSIH
jgi:hypothetical protein